MPRVHIDCDLIRNSIQINTDYLSPRIVGLGNWNNQLNETIHGLYHASFVDGGFAPSGSDPVNRHGERLKKAQLAPRGDTVNRRYAVTNLSNDMKSGRSLRWVATDSEHTIFIDEVYIYFTQAISKPGRVLCILRMLLIGE